ncbi:MAG: ferredoxin 1 [Bacteroidia bacterium]|nr:MAG: ferredoxin 1 [Bacteroidia bacterium]
MPWVITRLCADCVDTACVKVCPVDCIYGLTVDDPNYRKQLFIHPEECINCAACEPECPWGAIFEDAATPDVFKEDIEINVKVFEAHPKEEFTTTPDPIKSHPTPEEIEENYKKWGYQK